MSGTGGPNPNANSHTDDYRLAHFNGHANPCATHAHTDRYTIADSDIHSDQYANYHPHPIDYATAHRGIRVRQLAAHHC